MHDTQRRPINSITVHAKFGYQCPKCNELSETDSGNDCKFFDIAIHHKSTLFKVNTVSYGPYGTLPINCLGCFLSFT